MEARASTRRSIARRTMKMQDAGRKHLGCVMGASVNRGNCCVLCAPRSGNAPPRNLG